MRFFLHNSRHSGGIFYVIKMNQGGTAFEGPCKLSTFDVGDLQGLFCVLERREIMKKKE